MKKINNIQELKNVLSSLNTFEERYEFSTNDCEFSQVDIKNIDLEDVSNNSNEELENLVNISNIPIDERQKMRLENIKEKYDPIIEKDYEEENIKQLSNDLENFYCDIKKENKILIDGVENRINSIRDDGKIYFQELDRRGLEHQMYLGEILTKNNINLKKELFTSNEINNYINNLGVFIENYINNQNIVNIQSKEEIYSNFDLDVEGQLYPNMNSEYEYLNEDSIDVDLDFIMSHSLEDAKENLSEFLSDPDGNGMGIHGYDNRIHNIYEKSMETFLEKAKEIVNKKDNITHLEEDNTITIFNKTDNGLEKIATINLDDKDNMIVNISDVKMKTKILDYVEEIQENKIIQVNVSKSSNNYLSDFHKRAQQIMEKETEKNNKKDINL